MAVLAEVRRPAILHFLKIPHGFLDPLLFFFVFFCFSGDEDGVRRIKASRLRFNLQPLTTQRDFVNSYYYVKVATEMVSCDLFFSVPVAGNLRSFVSTRCIS